MPSRCQCDTMSTSSRCQCTEIVLCVLSLPEGARVIQCKGTAGDWHQRSLPSNIAHASRHDHVARLRCKEERGEGVESRLRKRQRI
eukprot:7934918-Pyramimonas_sp.AAC.1